MLNKLSFNLMSELNEADTKACEIKKQVFIESDKITIQDKIEEAAPVSTNQQIIDAKKDSADKGLYTEERKDKEERLASLKTQLEKDKEQLAADEIEAIEKEIADLEAELFEKEKLNETGEWDDNDEEMAAWKEDLRGKAEELAKEVNGECKVVKGFDKYQGPFAIVATPKHGDIEVWFDGEDDTGLSLRAKVAHKGWIEGGVIQLAELLNLDEIPEDQVITESEKLDNQILNEEIPEGTAALEKLKHGDEVYFRDSEGTALMGHYAESYPEPEEYDEGYTTGWERGADEEFDKAQDEKFAAAKQAAEERNVWEFVEIDETTLEPNGTTYGYAYGEGELIDWLNQLRIVNVRKSLEESYSDKLGGDPEDFVSDVEAIKAKLSEIDTLGFGSHLAVQMVEDWIETCNYQIEKGKRLASGNEFYTEADDRTYKDRDEAEYYRNKELYANSCLERHYDAMMAAKKACEEKGIKLDESEILKEDIEDLSMLIEETFGADGLIYKFEDNSVSADEFCYDFESTDFDSNEELLEFLENYYDAENTGKLDDNKYQEIINRINAGEWDLDESEKAKICEAEVKGLKEVKSQGNIFMLEDETKFIVGENYNEAEGLIENAEIYESKEEADKDYLGRCEITTTTEEDK